MSDEISGAIFLRLPADLRQWVAHEASVNRRSMNAVVVEAVDILKSTRTDQLAEDQHAAAIERAISVARLPKGTAIMLQTEHHNLRTKILVRRPSAGQLFDPRTSPRSGSGFRTPGMCGTGMASEPTPRERYSGRRKSRCARRAASRADLARRDRGQGDPLGAARHPPTGEPPIPPDPPLAPESRWRL